ncbi:MAG: VOC family protein [Candidatus Methanomethylicaceae archaeon]
MFVAKKIHHLGFVVASLDRVVPKWEKLLGIKAKREENPELNVKLAVFEIGGVRLVFNEPMDPESRWARFLRENGEGLEHIAVEVSDLLAASQAAQAAGVSLRFSEPKVMHGFLTNFVDRAELHVTNLELMAPASLSNP